MSFREKTAWITLVALVLVTLLYWFHVPTLFEAHSHGWVLHALLASLSVYLLIEWVAFIVLRLRHPRDAREPRDERERLIDLKAMRIAHYVFCAGSLGGLFVALHVIGTSQVGLAMVVFMAFVLSQMTRHAARIVYFRRS